MRVQAREVWLALLGACGGSGTVQYVDGKCLIGGVVSTLPQVEARQAALTEHILSRQPVLTAIAVAAVVLAGASYIQRLLTVLAARRASSTTFADRVRHRMERYRAHPVRYFSILGATLAILITAGVAYVQLDADKRTSERALATLQFCHLALRTADEQHVLAQQRDNLASIQSTAGDIRALVDKLPPAEQQKAHEIVDVLTSSLGQQRTLVTRYAAQADESTRAVQERQADVERGLSKLDGDLGTLKTIPSTLDKIDGSLRDLTSRDEDVTGRLAAASTHLDDIERTVSELASRPPPACPACSCAPPILASTLPIAAGSNVPADPADHGEAVTSAHRSILQEDRGDDERESEKPEPIDVRGVLGRGAAPDHQSPVEPERREGAANQRKRRSSSTASSAGRRAPRART